MDLPIIFVVDDDASVRRAIRRLLLSLKLPVRLFSSAEQFLSGVERGTRGCLILDLHLPGINVATATRNARRGEVESADHHCHSP